MVEGTVLLVEVERLPRGERRCKPKVLWLWWHGEGEADRWTWLVLAAYYAQLLLARGIVADRRLPWERPLPDGALTPTRVLRNYAALLPLVGTPATAPKPCGRSPGRPKGSLSGPAKRHPAVKKAA